MSLIETFNQKAKDVQSLPSCSNENKLTLYGLYKQATIGDNNEKAPMKLNVVNYKKWDAWNQNKGMSKDEAMNQYISLVDSLLSAQ
ncbi:hypothetical protein P9112_003210 [Eukaryota sp. TZLM1-RC]